jgi:hypothetical protein
LPPIVTNDLQFNDDPWVHRDVRDKPQDKTRIYKRSRVGLEKIIVHPPRNKLEEVISERNAKHLRYKDLWPGIFEFAPHDDLV